MNSLSPVPFLALAALAAMLSSATAAPFGAEITGKHGLTHASLLLQNDVNALMHNAVPVLVARKAGQAAIACGKMLRTDTMVTRMTSSSQWSEVWTYRVCDTKIAIPIDFTPDGKGGTNFGLRAQETIVTPAPP